MMTIQAGSTVYHRPSGTEWFVLGVNEAIGRLCASGKESVILKIAECELLDKGKGLTAKEQLMTEALFGPEWK